MKFLILNRASGQPHDLETTPGAVASHTNNLKGMLADGTLEAAWALLSGGHAYVTVAQDAEELALKLRQNPLFDSSHTEVLPIADAVDFLERFAALAGGGSTPAPAKS